MAKIVLGDCEICMCVENDLVLSLDCCKNHNDMCFKCYEKVLNNTTDEYDESVFKCPFCRDESIFYEGYCPEYYEKMKELDGYRELIMDCEDVKRNEIFGEEIESFNAKMVSLYDEIGYPMEKQKEERFFNNFKYLLKEYREKKLRDADRFSFGGFLIYYEIDYINVKYAKIMDECENYKELQKNKLYSKIKDALIEEENLDFY